MGLKLLVIVLFVKIVAARITLDVNINNQEADVKYKGSEAGILTRDEIYTIFGHENLKQALMLNRDITCILFFNFGYDSCGPAQRVLSIKSATVKRLNIEPVIMVSQDFENLSNHTIKVNAGISHGVENTLTTSWSKEREYSVTKDVEYEVSVGFSGFGGSYGHKNGYSFANKGGVSEQISKSETIGATSGMEVELKPGDAVTAVLSANAGTLEIEVVHQAYFKGKALIDCDCDITYENLVYVDKVCVSLEGLMVSRGIKNNLTTTETIKFNFYNEAKIRVYEKKSGLLIL